MSASGRGFIGSLTARQGDQSGSSASGQDTKTEPRRTKLKDVLADFDARGVEADSRDNLPRDVLNDLSRARAESLELGGKRVVRPPSS